MKNEHGLTQKQEAFAQAVVAGRSQSDAYRAAYTVSSMTDKQIWEEGSKLAANPKVYRRITELQERAAEIAVLDSAAILREVHRLAFSTPKGIYKEDGTLKMPHELDDATAACIKKFEIDELGRMKYEFHDKRGALDMAMKHRGLYKADNEQLPPAASVTRVELVALQPLKSVAKEGE